MHQPFWWRHSVLERSSRVAAARVVACVYDTSTRRSSTKHSGLWTRVSSEPTRLFRIRRTQSCQTGKSCQTHKQLHWRNLPFCHVNVPIDNKGDPYNPRHDHVQSLNVYLCAMFLAMQTVLQCCLLICLVGSCKLYHWVCTVIVWNFEKRNNQQVNRIIFKRRYQILQQR